MKFCFEKFIAPNNTGRYGRGDIAARGIMIFPYLFVRRDRDSIDFFELIRFTALHMYFFPRANPRIEPTVEPRIVIRIAKVVGIPAMIAAASAIAGERICGIRSRRSEEKNKAAIP